MGWVNVLLVDKSIQVFSVQTGEVVDEVELDEVGFVSGEPPCYHLLTVDSSRVRIHYTAWSWMTLNQNSILSGTIQTHTEPRIEQLAIVSSNFLADIQTLLMYNGMVTIWLQGIGLERWWLLVSTVRYPMGDI